MNETTRFMDRLFSATDEKDEELTEQVNNDIKAAENSKDGVFDTDEITYKSLGNGKFSALDKGTNETTIIERAEDGNYDLYVYEGEGTPAEMDNQIEGYLHPEGNGVTKGDQVGAPDEHVEDHLDGEGVSDFEKVTVEENAEGEGCSDKDECDSKEFSVSSDNEVVNRILQDQIYHERLFSDVLSGEEDTAIVGNLEIQKVDDEDNTLIVRDKVSNDLARVTLDDENMEVEELENKEFSECEYGYDDPEQFNAIHIVGVDAGNHNIIDSSAYTEEDAQELAARLTEEGVSAVEIFDNPQEAREYAINLLESLGVRDIQDIDEPEEATFSDHTIYVTRYYSDHTYFMDKMFSEAVNDIEVSQAKIEDAIQSGEEIETDEEVVTPIDANTAIVEDKENNEFTKVTLDGEEMQLDPISEEQAEDLVSDIAVEDTDEDLDEKDYSEVDFDEDERYYSDYEGPEIYCDEETQTKYFSEDEEMTEYMCRLFSDEADSNVEDIADAIESGEEIEFDGEIITPVDSNSAIIEDKENQEFTRAIMDIDGDIEVNPIPAEIARDILEDVAIEDVEAEPETTEPKEEEVKEEVGEENKEDNPEEKNEEKDEEKDEEKNYSYYEDPILDKFFADATESNSSEQEIIPCVMDPATGQLVPVNQATQGEDQPQLSVEAIEDKALAAIQSIQAVAAEGEAQILNAKAAPSQDQMQNLQEAQFSDTEDTENEKLFSDNEDTLVSWLTGIK